MAYDTSELLDDGIFALFWLPGLYGLYFVLFILAVWTTYQHVTPVSFRLRIATILMFCVVTAHAPMPFIRWSMRANGTGMISDAFAYKRIVIAESITGYMAGLISDGVLAWRCWVIWDRRRWLMWTLIALLVGNVLLGLSASVVYASFFTKWKRTKLVSQIPARTREGIEIWAVMTSVWATWLCIFNTIMTGSILIRIGYAACFADSAALTTSRQSRWYWTALRALVESSFTSWLSLVLFAAFDLAQSRMPRPTHGGHALDAVAQFLTGPLLWNSALVVLPHLFVLIVVRIGLAHLVTLPRNGNVNFDTLTLVEPGSVWQFTERDTLAQSSTAVRSKTLPPLPLDTDV